MSNRAFGGFIIVVAVSLINLINRVDSFVQIPTIDVEKCAFSDEGQKKVWESIEVRLIDKLGLPRGVRGVRILDEDGAEILSCDEAEASKTFVGQIDPFRLEGEYLALTSKLWDAGKSLLALDILRRAVRDLPESGTLNMNLGLVLYTQVRLRREFFSLHLSQLITDVYLKSMYQGMHAETEAAMIAGIKAAAATPDPNPNNQTGVHNVALSSQILIVTWCFLVTFHSCTPGLSRISSPTQGMGCHVDWYGSMVRGNP